MAWRLIEHLKSGNRKGDSSTCGTEIENLGLMKCVSSKGGDCCTKSIKVDGKKEKSKLDDFSMEVCPPTSRSFSHEYSLFENSIDKSDNDYVGSLDESKKRLLKSLELPTGSNLEIPWLHNANNNSNNNPTNFNNFNTDNNDSTNLFATSQNQIPWLNINNTNINNFKNNRSAQSNSNTKFSSNFRIVNNQFITKEKREDLVRSLENPTEHNETKVEIPWITINESPSTESKSPRLRKNKKRRNTHITIEEQNEFGMDSLVSSVSSFDESACSGSFSFKKRKTSFSDNSDSFYIQNVTRLLSDLSSS